MILQVLTPALYAHFNSFPTNGNQEQQHEDPNERRRSVINIINRSCNKYPAEAGLLYPMSFNDILMCCEHYEERNLYVDCLRTKLHMPIVTHNNRTRYVFNKYYFNCSLALNSFSLTGFVKLIAKISIASTNSLDFLARTTSLVLWYAHNIGHCIPTGAGNSVPPVTELRWGQPHGGPHGSLFLGPVVYLRTIILTSQRISVSTSRPLGTLNSNFQRPDPFRPSLNLYLIPYMHTVSIADVTHTCSRSRLWKIKSALWESRGTDVSQHGRIQLEHFSMYFQYVSLGTLINEAHNGPSTLTEPYPRWSRVSGHRGGGGSLECLWSAFGAREMWPAGHVILHTDKPP